MAKKTSTVITIAVDAVIPVAQQRALKADLKRVLIGEAVTAKRAGDIGSGNSITITIVIGAPPPKPPPKKKKAN